MAIHNPTAHHPEEDYHGHPNYFKTYFILLTIFGLSLAAGFLDNMLMAILLIFGMAIIKMMYVANNFMHLRFEPVSVWFAVIFGLVCCFIFYFGIYPDIMMVPLEVAR
ncbi:caa(3)-type oxidase subunit IV [bacterium (Candidatus Blackallbacteria) CG17_big_fil_post_rev_8_21_14_2_50_48_46]|uniref:Caa(3)-type oxidase subunit IV n=1 Tax=bacterium (Candidatus Blackallbacteria) CG17_big_fil_post_rev_8_21_14_2_50_48_46 TaxID=2014261 RepID=A0A2M7GB55_9BACT|nr:MAG: caa(3)-type oxidase subunit IV [bacterium (Candidatus Blackallbacteria) CG18_big_fil_WC_8_21_14_2_50_49_26]PIW19412.1 MAG: caa(3)-type oxidase subunit IV [bacterium (Candidatus Blackallbacteria) CG17_big_fil_post_rev_8_21_14_2_50_48_46]PIW48984.1 MAG: caa(3)-type oxidase subunit IV [bacterium (Candidatus Blackallbacteria) CG13_big_fil_rev_8_21_14_2_50_49_14]